MKQYLDICTKALSGDVKENRTGIPTIGYIGEMVKYDLSEGFPVLTTKKVAFKSAVAEMLCFLRGYDNVKDFQNLGCTVWNANAEADYWLNNTACCGDGDLGRIYGVQARGWIGPTGDEIDQLKLVVDKLSKGIDDRRLIVTHWNPGELNEMCLPSCHVLYKFSLSGGKLHLCLYQRSCDVPLGVPFNVVGYSWLLSVIAQITGYKAGTFTHFMDDVHIYQNQIPGIIEQLEREPKELPKLWINPEIKTLEDLETWVTTDDFRLEEYDPHPAIKFPFAV